MTKRDSQIADLPAPRVLRMASHDIDMSTALLIATPRPLMLLLALILIHKPAPRTLSHLATIHRFHHFQYIHHGPPRQRVGHSILFKVLEQILPSGHRSTSVLVEETDAQGYTKPKSLEFFFNGIIGHLRDRWGYALVTTTLCCQLANYWRSWFGAPTIGPVFETYTELLVWKTLSNLSLQLQLNPL